MIRPQLLKPSALSCQLSPLVRTQDRKRTQAAKGPTRTARAERDYARQLKQVGTQVGRIIAGFEPGDFAAFPSLDQLLRKYAEALTPWARSTASQMLLEVDARDRETWRSLGNEISKALQLELQTTPVGARIRELLDDQVGLIRSIPIEAGKRVHELTLKGLADSTRFTAHVEEIARSGDVAESRAVLIARTEVSRTASSLTEARARHIGSDEYFWRTAGDKDVRPSHKEMANKVVRWDSPPTLDNLRGHAGCLPNCRCYPEPIIPAD